MDFLPVGGLIVLASLLYMLLIGRRLLPERASLTQTFNQPDLHDTYQLADRHVAVARLAWLALGRIKPCRAAASMPS